MYYSRSIISRMSDLSVTESVSNYRDPFMMKENNYDDSNENIRTLTNTSEIVSEEEIIKMNLSQKNSTMISFSTWGKKVLHGFLSWHLWVQITLNDEIMEQYFVLSQKRLNQKKGYCLMSYIMNF